LASRAASRWTVTHRRKSGTAPSARLRGAAFSELRPSRSALFRWNANCPLILAEGITMGSSLSWQTDTQLHDSVQRQLEEDPHVESHDVAVIASEGVVTLTGFVHSYSAKLAAERAVKCVKGVRGIANEIQVAPLTERTDTDVARGAVHALRAHASVPIGVKVTARNGYLTLEGQVEWLYEKEAAADAVAQLDGVKGVDNLIAVKPPSAKG
jgi:osmotically-inducible protein OsmY